MLSLFLWWFELLCFQLVEKGGGVSGGFVVLCRVLRVYFGWGLFFIFVWFRPEYFGLFLVVMVVEGEFGGGHQAQAQAQALLA